MNCAYKLTANIVFPEGISPGAGTLLNRKIVERNGKKDAVLRGSALAGVLRAAYAEKLGVSSQGEAVSRWFGSKQEGDNDTGSVVRVADAVIGCNATGERTHNMINRHTGAVFKNALVSVETIPPMAKADLSITLIPGAGEPVEYEAFINRFAEIMGNGLLAGGNSNRGIGRIIAVKAIYLRQFNLDTVDGTADFLDAEYRERSTGVELKGDPLVIRGCADHLTIALELGIPRGEDLLIGDGQDADYTLKPQSVAFADGTEHWRIPGSSLRGIFRAWMTRLAARDGEPVSDSLDRWYAQEDSPYKPDLIGWGFYEGEERKRIQKHPYELTDPILDLFGSMYKKGRIHITDAYSGPIKAHEAQDRMHVAIDRFSGGANEGALFSNQVLHGENLRFPVTIILKTPSEKDVEWMVKTLRALHLGILHVGSSKGGGRLEIKDLSATCDGTGAITSFRQELVKNGWIS